MPPSPPVTYERFRFADGPGGRGQWSHSAEAVAHYAAGPAHCAIGGTIVFTWSAGYHDLVRMASAAHHAQCDFSGAEVLVAAGQAGAPDVTHYFECNAPGEVVYLACSVADHCLHGQKLEVVTSMTVRAFDAQSGATLLHVTSLSRVMRLLGFRADDDGGTHLERGYHSEEAANHSLEYVWCLEPHCPLSARDWLPEASESECLAEVHNLAGFISRKRPRPQLEHARAYYDAALAHEPDHCPTLGYLAELHVMTANLTAALATALRLCAACGPASAIARQIARSFATSGVSWPADACAVQPPPPLLLLPPPRPPPTLPPPAVAARTISFTLLIEGTLDAIDTDALAARVALEAAVNASRVTVTLTAASVRAHIAVAAESEAVASIAMRRLQNATASAEAASSAFALSIAAVESAPAVAVTWLTPPPPPAQPATRIGDGGSSEEISLPNLIIAAGILVSLAVYIFGRHVFDKSLPRIFHRPAIDSADAKTTVDKPATRAGAPPQSPGPTPAVASISAAEIAEIEPPFTPLQIDAMGASAKSALASDRRYGAPFSPAEKLDDQEQPTPRVCRTRQTKPRQAEANQTKPNQAEANQTKPRQADLRHGSRSPTHSAAEGRPARSVEPQLPEQPRHHHRASHAPLAEQQHRSRHHRRHHHHHSSSSSGSSGTATPPQQSHHRPAPHHSRGAASRSNQGTGSGHGHRHEKQMASLQAQTDWAAREHPGKRNRQQQL